MNKINPLVAKEIERLNIKLAETEYKLQQKCDELEQIKSRSKPTRKKG